LKFGTTNSCRAVWRFVPGVFGNLTKGLIVRLEVLDLSLSRRIGVEIART